jgi:hypothetical protein
MMDLRKFSLKRFLLTLLPLALFIHLTWSSKAGHTPTGEIYSTLTTDTIPQGKKDTVPDPRRGLNHPSPTLMSQKSVRDSITDSLERVLTGNTQVTIVDTIPVTDTFSLRISADTLDAPMRATVRSFWFPRKK